MHAGEGRRRGRGRGCAALAGLVLLGAALVLGLVAVGAGAGVLRSDPVGLLLVAAILALVGIGVFIAIGRR